MTSIAEAKKMGMRQSEQALKKRRSPMLKLPGLKEVLEKIEKDIEAERKERSTTNRKGKAMRKKAKKLNDFTCRMPDQYIELKNVTSIDFKAKGHVITQVALRGTHYVQNEMFDIMLPLECGSRTRSDSRKFDSKHPDNKFLTYSERAAKEITGTINIDSPEKIDNLREWLRDADPRLFEIYDHITIMLMTTRNISTNQKLQWVRRKSPDGTDKMIMELDRVNGKKFTELDRDTIIEAAGELFFSVCNRIPTKGSPGSKFVCADAVNAGIIDINTGNKIKGGSK